MPKLNKASKIQNVTQGDALEAFYPLGLPEPQNKFQTSGNPHPKQRRYFYAQIIASGSELWTMLELQFRDKISIFIFLI